MKTMYFGVKERPILVSAVIVFLVMSTAFAETSWKFIVTCDSRRKVVEYPTGVNTVILGELVDEIIDNGVELVLFPGDLVQGEHPDPSVTLETQLNNWRNIMQPVYDANISVYPCRGNHDVLCSGNCKDIWQGAFPELPDNGPPSEQKLTYSVMYKNSFIVALDQYVDPYHVNQQWLGDQLAGNTKPHVFIFSHQPAFCVYTRTPPKDGFCSKDPGHRNEFWASITDRGGRTYFCGHDHLYNHARIDDDDGEPCDDVHQYVVGTAGAGLRHDWDGNYPGPNDPYTVHHIYDANDYGYVLVEVDNYNVTLTWMERDTEDLNVVGTYAAKEEWSYAIQDSDCDGVADPNDNCPYVYNPGQSDDDSDGLGNACDSCATVPNPLGDYSGDCYVNLKDLGLLSIYWLYTDCGVANLWCERVDYDQNTDITLEEVLILAGDWLDCTDPDPPCSYVP